MIGHSATQRAPDSIKNAEDEGGRESIDSNHLLKSVLRLADLDLFTDRDYALQCDPENVVVLAHSHCLDSLHLCARTLVDVLNIPAQNILLLPKPYSTIPLVVRRMQALGIKVLTPKSSTNMTYDESMVPYVEDICHQGHNLATKLLQQKRKARVLLVDDGGLLTRQWLKSSNRRHLINAVSIQQTRSGVTVLGRTPHLPVINVAQSAAKRKFESHYIAKAIIKKTRELGHLKKDRSIGVFGLGMIGRAVAKALLDEGREISVCDELAREHDDEIAYWQQLKEASSRKNFVHCCDVIFGATAADWMRDELIPRHTISREKVLISCSSRDREFQYFLRQPKAFYVDDEDQTRVHDRFADVLWRPLDRQEPFRVVNGGFPVNFDRQKEWEQPEEIALTRVLILAATIQGLCTDLATTPASYIQLDAHIQRDLTLNWMRLCRKSAGDFSLDESRVNDISWWIRKSGGASPEPDLRRVVHFPTSRSKRNARLQDTERRRTALRSAAL